MIRTIETSEGLTQHADSLADFVGLRPSQANADHDSVYVFGKIDPEHVPWSGGHETRDAWRAYVQRGDAGLLASIRKSVGRVEPPEAPVCRRRRGAWMDDGDDYDVTRTWSGQVDTAFRGTKPRDVSGPATVRIVVNICENGSMPAEAFLYAGAAALVLADLAEGAGYSCEVVAAATAVGGREGRPLMRETVTVGIKAHGEPLDCARLAAAIGNVGTFRIGIFSLILADARKATCGLGRADGNPPVGLGPGDVYVNAWSEDAARKAVARGVAYLGNREAFAAGPSV